jgi:ribosomal protein L11 methyltransferase
MRLRNNLKVQNHRKYQANLKNYISYSIAEPSSEEQEILVAMLDGFNFDGFEQTDTSLIANALEGTINETEIENFFRERNTNFSKTILPEENWNNKWESDFHPIIIDDFVGVRANFHQPIDNVKHEIIITPKMSFGTGHHATTWMMMKAMEQIDFTNKTVIDFGTGTGILAILAEKMGSKQIIALDYDEWCINNSEENTAANHCKHISLYQASDLDAFEPVEILLANINRHILLEHLQSIALHVKSSGVLLLSGILATDKEEMVEACQKLGFEAIDFFEKNTWECIFLKKVA